MTKKKELLEMEDQVMQEDDFGQDGLADGMEREPLENARADGLPELTGEESSGKESGEPAIGEMSADSDSLSNAGENMDLNETAPEWESYPTGDMASAKPKRASRKRKGDAAEEMSGGIQAEDSEKAPDEDCGGNMTEAVLAEKEYAEEIADEQTEMDEADGDSLITDGNEEEAYSPPPSSVTERVRRATTPVLTLESRGEVETEESREDAIWHEIHNAYRTRRMLTGQLGGIEQTENGKTITIVNYKGFRIVIPLKEMMINIGRSPSSQEYRELMLRQNKLLGNMLGAEIDFIVKGIDSKTRSVVASRKEAMLRKRQIFYLDTDAEGMYRIYDNRIVQARVIAVAEKAVRIEAFGVECSILARDLSWDWIGDAHERFSVGDQVLVRILSVRRDNLEEIGIKADIKSVSQNTSHDNLKKCRVQSKYAGRITDVHKGVVYIRLSNGVNAVAHSCYDYRTPGKKDDVSFVVTKLDEERGIAVGIITRIIRQNL